MASRNEILRKKARQKAYKFKSKVWKYEGPAGWHFVTLSQTLSKKIRRLHGLSEEGWGRLKAEASMAGIEWSTAIWFDSKHMSYLLPIKSSVRLKADVQTGSVVAVTLTLQVEEPRLRALRTRITSAKHPKSTPRHSVRRIGTR